MKPKKLILFLLPLFLVAFIFFSDPVSSPPSKEKDAVKIFNQKVLSKEQKIKEQKLDDTDKKDLTEVLSERKKVLLEEIEKNPAIVKNNALPKEVRDRLPQEDQNLVEHEVEVKGKLTVLAAEKVDDKKIQEIYKIKSYSEGTKEAKRYDTYFIEKPDSLVSAPEVRAKGLALDTKLVLDSAQTGSLDIIKAATVAPLVSGNHSALVIGHNFTNDSGMTITKTQVEGSMFTNSDAVDRFYQENSYGNLSFSGTVTTLLTSSYNSSVSGCDVYQIADEADTAAINAGYTPASYDHVVYLFPRTSSCTVGGGLWAGLAEVGGSNVWINDYNYSDIYAHELGHNIGLRHANRINCGSKTIDVYSNCTFMEYGDWYDNMGNAYNHFNASHKEALGWLPGKVQTVSTNGTYTIYPMENNDANVKAIKIQKPNTLEYYYFEYRQATGFDSDLSGYPGVTRGIIGHIGKGDGRDTNLLDFTPANGTNDVALNDGIGVTDTINNIKITQLSHNSSSVTILVDFSGGANSDLVVTDSLVVYPSYPAIGQDVTASVKIKNISNRTIDYSHLGITNWYNYPQANVESFGYDTSSSILSGETKTVQFTRKFNDVGYNYAWTTAFYDGSWHNIVPLNGMVSSVPFSTRSPNIKVSDNVIAYPSYPAIGQQVTATAKVTNYDSFPVSLDNILFANWYNYPQANVENFGSQSSLTINPSETLSLNYQKTFTNIGYNYAWIAMQIGGKWHNLDANNGITKSTFFYTRIPNIKLTDSVVVLPSFPLQNEEVMAKTQIKNFESTSISLDNILLACWKDYPAANVFNFDSLGTTTMSPNGILDISKTRAFIDKGLYYTWPAMQIGDKWYNISPNSSEVSGVSFGVR